MLSAQQIVLAVCDLLSHPPVSGTLTLTHGWGQSHKSKRVQRRSASRNRGNTACRKDKDQGGGTCRRASLYQRGRKIPQHRETLQTEQEVVSGQKLGLYMAANAWALHVSATVLLASSLRPGRREGHREPRWRATRQGTARTSVIDKWGWGGQTTTLEHQEEDHPPERGQMDRRGTELNFSGKCYSSCHASQVFGVCASYLFAGD